MDKEYYRLYFDIERNHWWFKARSRILRNYIKKNIAGDRTLEILNVGVATGASSVMLQEFGKVVSLEYDAEPIEFIKGKVPIEVIQGSILELPFEDDQFDLVCAFDVIEHVEDHELAIKEVKRVAKRAGSVLLTVPAGMNLWSEHDEINHHFRRYSLPELDRLVNRSGGERVYSSYFNFFLFPFIYTARKVTELVRDKKRVVRSDFEKFSPGILGSVLYLIMKSESILLNRKVRLPWGVSALLHWKKEG
ncbi:MAG: class I SAM-dependent methyltransferase, partial [Cyclobacteriaceae bacterium]|nr:class I SAM-dependent methyltransferase [Cyclobacteriaceae bacterium]